MIPLGKDNNAGLLMKQEKTVLYYLSFTVINSRNIQATVNLFNETDNGFVVVDVSFDGFLTISASTTLIYSNPATTTSHAPACVAYTTTPLPTTASGLVIVDGVGYVHLHALFLIQFAVREALAILILKHAVATMVL